MLNCRQICRYADMICVVGHQEDYFAWALTERWMDLGLFSLGFKLGNFFE